jgi:hypothetical protein
MPKIKSLFDPLLMQEVLNAPIDYFTDFGTVIETPDGILIHNNIGSQILGVAHLDSVNTFDHFHIISIGGEDHLFNTHVDDRLGAYILLYVLPSMGIHTDILLTEGEEKGKSTAKHFESNRQYNWMYSFDRRGTDCVHYQYQSKDWKDVLTKHFKTVLYGSNSDIAYLEHLKCCGVNVGTGYYEEHHKIAHANLSETIRMVGRFIQFYQQNKRTLFPFEVKYKSYKYQPVIPPAPIHPQLPPLPPASEEKEEEEFEVYNPYELVYTDIALDVRDYLVNGVLHYPTQCSICEMELKNHVSDVFMGICKHCEPYAVQCIYCGTYVAREEDADISMDDADLFFGICQECSQLEPLKEVSPNDNVTHARPLKKYPGEPVQSNSRSQDDNEERRTDFEFGIDELDRRFDSRFNAGTTGGSNCDGTYLPGIC